MRYLLLRLKRFCGFITGFVFFFSGILKLLDPVGAGLVMDEYFHFLHIGFMGFAAKPLGVALALLETLIGTALLTGVWRKITTLAAMAFQGFFTFLTLLLVIFNPDMDCGCFGEAVHLTHMQTFLKNLVLCALLAIFYFPAKFLGEPKPRKYVSFGLVAVSTVLFMIYSLVHIPLVDFTEFKPTAVLQVGDHAKFEDELYDARFTYEKDGVQETFSLGHLPDSSWTFVSAETVRKNEEHDMVVLSFHDKDGEYMDDLAGTGKVMIVSVYDPDIKEDRWLKIKRFLDRASAEGFTSLLLTAGEPENYDGDYYLADYKTLITLNRSNGGATYFDEGNLISKWAYANLPDKAELAEVINEHSTGLVIEEDIEGSLGFQGFLLYVFAVMLLL